MTDIKIAIAEDHTILRNTLSEMLENEDGMKVLFNSPNGKELVDKLASENADIVILDLNMPIMDGREAMVIIKRNYPDTKVIILSMYHTQHHIEKNLTKGANGFLNKGCDYKTLVRAIKEVHETGYFMNEFVTPKLLEKVATKKALQESKTYTEPFTNREIEILELICSQSSNEEIESKLSISHRLIKSHKLNIFRKSGTNTDEELIQFAIKKGYVEMKV